MKLRNLDKAACGRECQHMGWGLCLLAELNLKSLAIKKWATTLLILVRPEQPPPRTKPWGRFCKTWAPGVWPPRRVSS